MTLLEIRTKLVEVTGRNDLVVDTTGYADAGADFYIREGQRFLDRLVEGSKGSADIAVSVTAGQASVSLGGIRAVRGLRWVGEDGISGRILLEPADVLRNRFSAEGGTSSIGRGTPTHAAVVPVRDSVDPDADSETNKGILFLPPAESAGLLIVEGLAFSAELIEDDSVSFWSVAEPFLLVQASMLMIEQLYRNSQGQNDLESAIRTKAALIDLDEAEEGAAGIWQMRNSW